MQKTSFSRLFIIIAILCSPGIQLIAQDNANGSSNNSLKIKVRDLDNKMRAAIWKKIEVNDKRRKLSNLAGNETLSVNCNDDISVWGTRNNMTSIQCNKWKPIDSLVFYLGKEKNVPKDSILEGTIYIRDMEGKIRPAENTKIDIEGRNETITTDLLGRFTIKFTCGQIKLKLKLSESNIPTDVNTPPDIDLTITTSDNDRAKIDVYVNDLGTRKDGE